MFNFFMPAPQDFDHQHACFPDGEEVFRMTSTAE